MLEDLRAGAQVEAPIGKRKTLDILARGAITVLPGLAIVEIFGAIQPARIQVQVTVQSAPARQLVNGAILKVNDAGAEHGH
jgi:hypothetical protein